MNSIKTPNLDKIERILIELNKSFIYKDRYFVPGLWANNPNTVKVEINPIDYFLTAIKKIRALGRSSIFELPNEGWTKSAVIYNLFVRYTTAFDHNDDSIISQRNLVNGFRETGTFLKALGLIPYIHSLGINTVHLLPITSIGKYNRKGNLGSPYSIRNPYKLDENLSEPALGIDIETQFAAFVEALHLLGMKCILEFVFRTASIDSDLAIEYPEWFYWIKDKLNTRTQYENDESRYGPPLFNSDELLIIKEKVEKGNLQKLPPPHRSYLNMFTKIPKKVFRENEKVIGEDELGNRSTIPGAFADWPPDDAQPVWSDVTYLKLFEHKDFNYIAYNTVRMYDSRLSKAKNRVKPLWESIAQIIPYYQKHFSIDGIMLDMGHALPSELRKEIVNQARIINENFMFWEENFIPSKSSVKEGYEAIVGYLPFDEHIPWKLKSLLKWLSSEGTPIPFFATAETHNTHRAANRFNSIEFNKFTWAFNNFIPALPFIHSGFELGEDIPVNTGLEFEMKEIEMHPPEKLPLFSVSNMKWKVNKEIIDFFIKISELRRRLIPIQDNFLPETLLPLNNHVDSIIAFIRIFPQNKEKCLFAGNLSENSVETSLYLNGEYELFHEFISESNYNIDGSTLFVKLKPFEVMIGNLIASKTQSKVELKINV